MESQLEQIIYDFRQTALQVKPTDLNRWAVRYFENRTKNNKQLPRVTSSYVQAVKSQKSVQLLGRRASNGVARKESVSQTEKRPTLQDYIEVAIEVATTSTKSQRKNRKRREKKKNKRNVSHTFFIAFYFHCICAVTRKG